MEAGLTPDARCSLVNHSGIVQESSYGLGLLIQAGKQNPELLDARRAEAASSILFAIRRGSKGESIGWKLAEGEY